MSREVDGPSVSLDVGLRTLREANPYSSELKPQLRKLGKGCKTPHQPLSQYMNILDTILLSRHVIVSKHPCHPLCTTCKPRAAPRIPTICPSLSAAP